MDKEQIFELMAQNPAFALATMDGDNPRVRYVLMYRADENGIIFHTSPVKDLYHQIIENKNAELCFYDPQKNVQVRVSGRLEQVDDMTLKDEICEHPSRAFLRAWRDSGTIQDFYNTLKVFRLSHGKAIVWTMGTNFAPKTEIQL